MSMGEAVQTTWRCTSATREIRSTDARPGSRCGVHSSVKSMPADDLAPTARTGNGTMRDKTTLSKEKHAYEIAYTHIREKIIAGVFSGGMKLNPTSIGDALGISRMPVREAIRQLDSEGLVTIRPNRGAVVTQLTPQEVAELFEIRSVLEGLAGRCAVANLTGSTLHELQKLYELMNMARGEVDLWINRHNAFHDFICMHSGMPKLYAEIKRVRDLIEPYLRLYIDVYHNTEIAGYEHALLMEAIRNQNADLLENCIRDHVMSPGNGVIRFLEKTALAETKPTPAAFPTGERSHRQDARPGMETMEE